GQGQGLSLRDLGEQSGVESITLLVTEIPVHTHSVTASEGDGTERNPNVAGTGQLPATGIGISMYQAPGPLVNMAFQALSPAGGSLPHNNMQPYLTLNYCIALQGIFPQRP